MAGGPYIRLICKWTFHVSNEVHRRAPRDSVYLLASLRIENAACEHGVKIRNLSATGLMAEGDTAVSLGSLVCVHIRKIGWVRGSVCWIVDKRFGVRFDAEIDPIKARTAV